MEEIISSVSNKKVKDFIKLDEHKVRKEEKRFTVEGIHLVNEAIKKGIVDEIFVTEDSYDDLKSTIKFENYNTYLIKENVAEKMSNTVTTQGIFAVCEMTPQAIDYTNNVLLLDRVQDPGNVGTLIRSAASFNFRTIVASPQSVNFYNAKVIRSTQGNFFQVNLVHEYLIQTINDLKDQGYIIIGTQMHEDSKLLSKVRFDDDQKYALIIGNESVGISSEITDLLDMNILIDMQPDVESLNAAVAGSLIMYGISVA